MICPHCSTENAPNVQQCVRCGGALISNALPLPDSFPLGQFSALQGEASIVSPVQAGAVVPAPPPMPSAPPGFSAQTPPYYPHYPLSDGQFVPGAYAAPYPPTPNIIDTIIPMRNPKALAGYYLGVFSVIPVLGILLGIAAFTLGIMGLKEANREPAIKGKTHAWVGILVGGFFGFGYLILTALAVIAVLTSSHSGN